MIDIEKANLNLAKLYIIGKLFARAQDIDPLYDYLVGALVELERLQKKETPMKVDTNSYNAYDDCFICPKCKKEGVKQGAKFCDYCGQALRNTDWSDEK